LSQELYVLPAAFGQQRLWLLEQIHPETALYSEAIGLRLTGPLDPAALSAALTGIVERHEVLHTVLRLDGAEVAQVVLEPEPVKLAAEEIDGGLPAALAAAQELAGQPFDLAAGPLLRHRLLRVSPDDHLLVVVVHHAVSDGWSTGVMLGELTTRYAAAAGGDTAELPDLPVQYADFAAWQRQRWTDGELAGQLGYWRDHLSGVEPLRLPSDHRTATAGTSVHADLRLPAAMVTQLRAVAPDQDVTPFMVALTAYAVVLARWTRQDDVVIGLPFAGRSRPELEELVGFFVNTLPVRVDLTGHPGFLDLLGQVREGCLGAYLNAEVPFEMLVEELKPQRRAGQMPLAQTMLAVNNTPLPASVRVAGLTIEPVHVLQTQPQFAVTVDLTGTGDALTGAVVLDADLFAQETADLLAASIRSVLRGAAASPSTAVSALPCPIAEARAAAPEQEEPLTVRVATADGTPQTPAEILLCRLWTEILELDTVGVDDEFYAKGGNSLRAVRVVMRAREMGLDVPMEQVLGDHTIRDLARALGRPDPA
jgi:hypothetical protein